MVDEAQRQRTNFKRPEYFRERAPYNPDVKPEYFRELPPYNPDVKPEYFREPYRPDFNKRPPKDFPTGIMLAMNNNPTMNKIKNIYNRVDPFVPDINIDDREIGYDY